MTCPRGPIFALAGTSRRRTLKKPGLLRSRGGSALMRSAIHVMAALVVSIAMPAAAQFAGGGELATLMQLDVPSVVVEGDFLRNSRAFPSDVLDSGNFYIESGEGDLFFLGNSSIGAYGPLRVVSGRYEPQFSSFFEPATAPRSNRVPFSAPLTVETDQVLDLNVPAVRVSLSFLLNGATFPGSPDQNADFLLRHRGSGREVPIGTSQQAVSAIYVVPGVYDVIYAHRSGTLIPANTRTVILEKILIDQPTSLVVDVPMVFRTFTYMLNGVPFPNSGLDFGHIHLEDPSTAASFFVGRTSTPALLRVIPGTYRVIYAFRETQGVSPTNPWAIVDEDLLIDLTGITGIQVEVTTHSVDPVFLMDGLAFPGGGFANAQIEYRAGNGAFVSLGRTHEVPATKTLIEGSYDFYYRLLVPGSVIPSNAHTRFATGVVLDQSGPLPVNIETAVLDLNLRLDGAPFPYSGLNFGRIHLIEPETGAESLLGRSYEAPFLRRVIRGEYDVVYAFWESQGLTPLNRWHVVARGLQVNEFTSTLIDIRTQLVAPRFSLDGVEFPDVESDHGRFLLRDADGDEVLLGNSHEASPDILVIEGTYQVDYEWQSGTAVPANPRETIASVVVPEPGFAVGLFVSILGIRGLAMRRRE